MKRGSLLISINPNERLTDPSPVYRLVNVVNNFDFSILHTFSFCDPVPTIFSWNPQFLMPNAKGILFFWSKFEHFLSICLYDAYDMKFMQ